MIWMLSTRRRYRTVIHIIHIICGRIERHVNVAPHTPQRRLQHAAPMPRGPPMPNSGTTSHTAEPRSLDATRSLFADRYRIERELGRGGMATVYLAEETKHGRAVAIKVLHPEVAPALGAERFLR